MHDLGRLQIDHVIGAFQRERLSMALAATHRAGFGPNCRVFDGARDHTARQLDRAGLAIHGDAAPAGDALLIVVTAPGRTSIVAELYSELGAEAVFMAGRRVASASVLLGARVEQPDVRVDRPAIE